ncbi:MAG: hypothetical protein A2527_08975 [Candidatus Lambdaproteobacteria bacterium RIFOXYD2_FULL_50_16]|uniref:Uncharacterized protein n=1 Tax=Candidatus Lambdaproteobacteria bacterium RIFOXYD2_FULL_50_16 TaxID=1817772 RepID=A0A1F6GAY8_9PROT|nr:MAG: hypothetical protein A2527_08975 [Candidatus Lambdaproteobacteria bacterium RIFOXYD2_FULL_50_16]
MTLLVFVSDEEIVQSLLEDPSYLPLDSDLGFPALEPLVEKKGLNPNLPFEVFRDWQKGGYLLVGQDLAA